MPQYYRYGYQSYPYEAEWSGRPWPSSSPAASTRSLGDVTKPGFIVVPPSEDPYLLHKEQYERTPEFFIPKAESPYWLHEQAPAAIGAFAPSRMEKQALVVAGLGAAAYFLLRKGGPLGKRKR